MIEIYNTGADPWNLRDLQNHLITRHSLSLQNHWNCHHKLLHNKHFEIIILLFVLEIITNGVGGFLQV